MLFSLNRSLLLLAPLLVLAGVADGEGDQANVGDGALILTSRELHTVAVMDIEGLATYDDVDALTDRQRRSAIGGPGNFDGAGSRDGRGGGGTLAGSGAGSFVGVSTRNGNFSVLPFKVHAVNGLDELSIEKGPLFNASIEAYFPRGALLMLQLKGTADGIGSASFLTSPGTTIVETSRTRKHTATTIYLEHSYAGLSTAETNDDNDDTTTYKEFGKCYFRTGDGDDEDESGAKDNDDNRLA